ncbi:hypothetical protein Q5752_005089 [Cryptotrichosporon argae]
MNALLLATDYNAFSPGDWQTDGNKVYVPTDNCGIASTALSVLAQASKRAGRDTLTATVLEVNEASKKLFDRLKYATTERRFINGHASSKRTLKLDDPGL